MIGDRRLLFWLLGSVLAVAIALAASFAWSQPPTPRAANAPLDVFSAERALAHVRFLLDDNRPHPVGTASHRAVGDRIARSLSDLGYAVEEQETFTCSDLWATCADVRNIMARIPASGDSEGEGGRAVLLTAHYDSVPAGPGAADDMASVAILLEIASMLRGESPTGNPVIFLISDAEEPGLIGAKAFVEEHPWAAEVGAVVNLEARGTNGMSLLFETSENNGWLIDGYAEMAPRPVANSLFYELYKVAPNNTDFTVYKRAGLPGVNFAFTDGGTRYHTPLDSLDFLDAGSVQHQGDNTLAMVHTLANRDLTSPQAGNLVYVDLIPGTVLRWPANWTIAIAFGCVLAWMVFAAGCFVRKLVSAKQFAWGVALVPVALACASVLALGVTAVLVELTGHMAPWYAEPQPARLAMWFAAIAGMVAAGMLLGRRAGAFGVATGVWFWWMLLTLLVAWFLPGASVMFLTPTMAGLLLLIVGLYLPGRKDDRILMASLFGLAIMSWFWLPFALVLETMDLYAATGAAVAAIVVLGLSPGLPILALSLPQARNVWIGAALPAVVALAALAWAIATPTYSVASPQRLNVLHVDDRANDEAYLALGGDVVGADSGANVPESLLAAAPFSDRPAATLPWSTDRLLTAPTMLNADTPPLATVLEDRITDGERRVRVRLELAPGATRSTLYFPAEMPVSEITIAESGQTVIPSAADNGYRSFGCLGLSCAGREVEVTIESDDPVSFLVATFSPELPEAASTLAAARPVAAQQSHDGDQYIRIDRVDSQVEGP